MTLATLTPPPATVDLDAVKTKQQAIWGLGDYGRIGVTLQITGEQLCEAMDLRSGATVLDVAGGNGNITLAAARRFAKVLSTDYVPVLLEHSAQRAAAEGLAVDYQEADAEALPFEDGQFDNVVSTFGVMFTPDQAQAAAEMVRVCRKGGRIGLANWTPEGFIGQLFKTIGRFVPPPTGVSSPAAWGTPEFLDTHFAPHATDVAVKTRWFAFRYESPRHFLELFRTYYGPMVRAFESLDAEGQAGLEAGILDLIDRFNRSDDGTMVVPASYLEIVVTR